MLKFTKDHEWLRMDGDIATVGITPFAQEKLGDLVFVELPSVGATFDKGAVAATVESVKAAADVYAPIAGKVIAVNDKRNRTPREETERIIGQLLREGTVYEPREGYLMKT